MNDDEKLEIYKDGFIEGQKHIIPSSLSIANKEEIAELKNEWDQFKSKATGYLIAYITLLIGSIVGYAIWVGDINRTVAQNKEAIMANARTLADFDRRIQANDITSAGVIAKLSGIEATLSKIEASIGRR